MKSFYHYAEAPSQFTKAERTELAHLMNKTHLSKNDIARIKQLKSKIR